MIESVEIEHQIHDDSEIISVRGLYLVPMILAALHLLY